MGPALGMTGLGAQERGLGMSFRSFQGKVVLPQRLFKKEKGTGFELLTSKRWQRKGEWWVWVPPAPKGTLRSGPRGDSDARSRCLRDRKSVV